MSIKRLGGRTCESRHVSSSPSKIPYGGFSPVRLQTGYEPWRPSPGNAAMPLAQDPHRQLPPFAHTALRWPMVLWTCRGSCRTPPVQRPLARQRVVLSHQVIAYYGRIRVSRALPPIYVFIQRIFPCQSYPGSSREVPQFTLLVFPSVPTSIPRWTGKVLLTVSSLPALAFTSLAMFRHPNIPRNPIQRGGLTRLQSLLHVTARQVCLPCIGQDFYSRAFTPFVAIGSVEYDYTGNSQFPRLDSHQLDTQHYGLRAKQSQFSSIRVDIVSPYEFECSVASSPHDSPQTGENREGRL